MVTADYGYVLLAASIMSFEVIMFGFIFPGGARRKTFPKAWLEDNFGAMHREQIGEDIKEGGAPDMGSGLYSQKLSYKDWYEFNSAQRVHLNFVEFIATQLTLLLIGGLYFPILAAVMGLVCIIGRIIYGIGYAMKGPQGRTVGALLTDAALLTLFILSLISSIYLIQNKAM